MAHLRIEIDSLPTEIDVVERRPVYIWKVDPTLYLVSEEGIVLGTTPTEEGLLVVVVFGCHPVLKSAAGRSAARRADGTRSRANRKWTQMDANELPTLSAVAARGGNGLGAWPHLR